MSALEDSSSAFKSESEANNKLSQPYFRLRYAVCVLSGIAMGSMFALRLTMTMAMLNMVNQTHLYLEQHPNKTVDDYLAEGHVPNDGHLIWNNEIQQTILSCYMISHTILQVPMIRLASWLGKGLAMGLSLLLCALITLSTPSFVELPWQVTLTSRLLHGLVAAPVVSLMLDIVHTWSPPDERSFCLGLSQITSSVLLAATPLIGGLLSSIHWKVAFYVPGGVVVVFVIIWLTTVTSEPEHNRWISMHELEHIQRSQAIEKANAKSIKRASILDILRHPTFYAILLSWCLYCAAGNTFTFVLPTYLKRFLRVSVSDVGLYASLIQVGMIVSNVWPQCLLKLFRGPIKMSESASRKCLLSIACLGNALAYTTVAIFHRYQVGLLFIGRSMSYANTFLFMDTLMIVYGGSNMSGTAMSMMNTIANFSASPLCTTIGWALDRTGQSTGCWSVIFFVFAGALFTVMLVYDIFVKLKPAQLGPLEPLALNCIALNETQTNAPRALESTNFHSKSKI